MILANQKTLFSIPSGITYLNCANLSPHLNSVFEAGIKAITNMKNPWKIKIEDWFNPAEELRDLCSKILSTKKENIALVPSVSYAIAIAAKNLLIKPGKKILLLDKQYPSNVYAWRELAKKNQHEIVTVKKRTNETWTESILHTLDNKTGLVTIPNCHWTDGSLINLEAISEKVKKVGSKLVIDASQSMGAYPLDINKIKPDFLTAVGYKWLLGPYHLAYFYSDPQYHKTGDPIEYSWLTKSGSEDFTSLVDYTDKHRPGARRFDGGEFPSFIQIPMAIAALKQILKWGVENIQETLSKITEEIERMAEQRQIPTTKSKDRVGHMISLKMSGDQITVLGKRLRKNNIYVSFRGDQMRIAPHLYTDLNDIHNLFKYI